MNCRPWISKRAVCSTGSTDTVSGDRCRLTVATHRVGRPGDGEIRPPHCAVRRARSARPEPSLAFQPDRRCKKENVPKEPVMSGVPMPESDSPSHSAGGKLAGMRITFAAHAVFFEHLPKRTARAQAPDTAAGQGNQVRPNRQRTRRLSGFGHRGHRHTRSRVAMDEIEDAVAAGIHPGDDTGPRHRALRRDRGGQAAERALPAAVDADSVEPRSALPQNPDPCRRRPARSSAFPRRRVA